MPEVKWLPEALDELDALLANLNRRDPPTAVRAAVAIRRGADLLQELPEIGRALGDGSGRREMILPLRPADCALLYRLDDEGAVVLLRVRHDT